MVLAEFLMVVCNVLMWMWPSLVLELLCPLVPLLLKDLYMVYNYQERKTFESTYIICYDNIFIIDAPEV